jgi:transcriptional regulator with XRE-family HTH domain
VVSRRPLTPAQRAEGRRLAADLRSAREVRRQGQAELARRSGVSVDAIRALEGNRIATPSFFTVARIARELELGLDALARNSLAD